LEVTATSDREISTCLSATNSDRKDFESFLPRWPFKEIPIL
jgi:hypothetical protein